MNEPVEYCISDWFCMSQSMWSDTIVAGAIVLSSVFATIAIILQLRHSDATRFQNQRLNLYEDFIRQSNDHYAFIIKNIPVKKDKNRNKIRKTLFEKFNQFLNSYNSILLVSNIKVVTEAKAAFFFQAQLQKSCINYLTSRKSYAESGVPDLINLFHPTPLADSVEEFVIGAKTLLKLPVDKSISKRNFLLRFIRMGRQERLNSPDRVDYLRKRLAETLKENDIRDFTIDFNKPGHIYIVTDCEIDSNTRRNIYTLCTAFRMEVDQKTPKTIKN